MLPAAVSTGSDVEVEPRVADPPPMSHRRRLESLSGLLLVLFVATISSTVVSMALPRILGELNGTQTQFTWVVTAALLAATATTPLWGRLADLFSKKLLVQIAIAIFIVGSLISGFAQGPGQLITARAFQGIGVGGLQALVQIIIAAMIPPRERGRYNGYLGAVLALATVGGPLLGGLIVDVSWLGWRWCFFVGAPIAALAFLVLQFTLPPLTSRTDNAKVDYLGAGLIATGVSGLLVWVSFVDNAFGWVSWQSFAILVPSLVILAAAFWVEKRAPEPVVPIDVLRQRTPAVAIVASFAVGMAMFGCSMFLGQYLQVGRDYSPSRAGLLTVPLMLGLLISSTVVGRLITRTGKIKPYIVVGAVLLTVGFFALGTVEHDTPLAVLAGGMLLVGMGFGMAMQNLVLAIQNAVSLRDLGAASGSVTFFRMLGGTIGVSVLGALLAHRVSTTIAENLKRAGLPGAGADGSTLNLDALPSATQAIVRAAYGDSTGHIFYVSAGVGAVAIIAALLLKPVTLRSSLDLPAQAVIDPSPEAPAPQLRRSRV